MASVICRVIRDASQWLTEPLSPEDATVQSMPDVSPTKWHLAHVTWFFETFVLEGVEGYRPFNDAFRVLFNSYYNTVGEQFPRPRRGLVTRPGLADVLDYRAHVDEHLAHLLESGAVEDDVARVIEVGLNHEQQHQELLLMDIKHVLSCNPLNPVYREAPPFVVGETAPLRWHAFDGNVLRWRDPEATEWLGAIRIGPNARCRRGASREDGYVALDVACDDWAATLLAPSRDERRRWLAALDPRPVPSRPTPKKLVLKSPRVRRPPASPPSTPSPSTTDFEALLPLTHRERSRAAAVARAVDAYLETRSGRARKVVVEAVRRSAPLADEVYCRLLLADTHQAWELLGAVAAARAPSDAALCGVVREAAVGARAAGVVGAMDAALEAFSSAA